MIRTTHGHASALTAALLAGAVAVALAGTAAAQGTIYKFVGPDGRVTYTDQIQQPHYMKLVKTWKAWVFRRPSTRSLAAGRKRFAPTIDAAAMAEGVPAALVHAVVSAESAYDPDAISTAGAAGLMQLMPETASRYGVIDRTDPEQNVRGGTRYLHDLLALFQNDLPLVLAAYNAGEGAVKKYGNRIPPYAETQEYVRRVQAYYQTYLEQEAGGKAVPPAKPDAAEPVTVRPPPRPKHTPTIRWADD